MPLDRILRLCVRNFSTLFLVVFVAIVPLHLIYAFVFHDVFALQELHGAIADLPKRRMVRGVDQAAIARAELWFWILAVVEVAAIPLFVRATRRTLVLDAQGRVPNALAAWRTRDGRSELGGPAGTGAGATFASLVVGVVIGALTWFTIASIVELLPDPATGAGVAVADAASRAAGAAFPLTALALRSRREAPKAELKI